MSWLRHSETPTLAEVASSNEEIENGMVGNFIFTVWKNCRECFSFNE
jgi:hypothetical protein